MKFVCALIVVEDMARARDFYENILGQKLKYDFGENVQYGGGFSLHLGEHYRRLLGLGDHAPVRPAHNCELYFETDVLDEAYGRLRRHDVRFVHELREQPWGQRVMRFYDPDENVIEVGESMEAVARRFHGQGMTPAEICRRTSLPPEFVAAALAGEEAAGGISRAEGQAFAASCGIDCSLCEYRGKMNCPGCHAVGGKPFWGVCPIAACTAGKGHLHCGYCAEFVCPALHRFAYDPEHGDDGKRIANLRARLARGE